MDNRKIDHTVAQAILHYMLSDEGQHVGLDWGNLKPDDIKRRLSVDSDKHGYVAVFPLFQWLAKNETVEMIAFGNKSLNKFRYLVSRASVK